MQNIGTSLAFCINKTGFGWEVFPDRQVGRHSTIITWRQQTEPKKQKQGTHSRNPSLTPNLFKLLLSSMRVPCLAALDSTAVDPVRTHTQRDGCRAASSVLLLGGFGLSVLGSVRLALAASTGSERPSQCVPHAAQEDGTEEVLKWQEWVVDAQKHGG